MQQLKQDTIDQLLGIMKLEAHAMLEVCSPQEQEALVPYLNLQLVNLMDKYKADYPVREQFKLIRQKFRELGVTEKRE